MEIIARFPALPIDEPRPVEPAGEASIVQSGTVAVVKAAPSSPVAASRSPRNRMAGGMVRPQFPVRSVMVLVVLAIAAWSLALHSDAARRQAARMAQAAPAGVVR